MDRGFSFPEVFAVQIQHIRFPIERSPNRGNGGASDVQTIGTRIVFGNREIRDHDGAVWHGVDQAMLTRDRAPSHGQGHDSVVMLTTWCAITCQAGR